jgi:hypothetical protein
VGRRPAGRAVLARNGAIGDYRHRRPNPKEACLNDRALSAQGVACHCGARPIVVRFVIVFLFAVALGGFRGASAQTLRDLSDLSLEELSQVEITSVSKRPEPLSDATAAIYVITNEDIRRSGVTSLAEALRLAPNLEVARVDSQTYNISSRGMK